MESDTLHNKNYHTGAMYMHALTLATEAAVSRYYKPDIEATAVQIISFLLQSMACGEEVESRKSKVESEKSKVEIEEKYNVRMLEEAAMQAERLADRGYGGYAQAIGEAMNLNYLVPAGVTEALVLPELLRAYGTKAESRIAELARKTGLVAADLPDDRTTRLFISWIEQQRVLFELPDHIAQMRPQDFPDIIDDALDATLHFYPTPVFYDAIDLEQFLIPLLPLPQQEA